MHTVSITYYMDRNVFYVYFLYNMDNVYRIFMCVYIYTSVHVLYDMYISCSHDITHTCIVRK